MPERQWSKASVVLGSQSPNAAFVFTPLYLGCASTTLAVCRGDPPAGVALLVNAMACSCSERGDRAEAGEEKGGRRRRRKEEKGEEGEGDEGED